MYLNGLAAGAPWLGRLTVLVATYGVVLYVLLPAWLWVRRLRDPVATLINRQRLSATLLLAAGAVGLSLGVNAVLNVAVPRLRPFLVLPAHVLLPSPPRDASFPSDHAALTTAVAVTLLLGGEAGWGRAALTGAALIGIARVAAGVHYPSDILGGMLVGAVCAAGMIRARGPLKSVLDRVLAIARRCRLA